MMQNTIHKKALNKNNTLSAFNVEKGNPFVKGKFILIIYAL